MRDLTTVELQRRLESLERRYRIVVAIFVVVIGIATGMVISATVSAQGAAGSAVLRARGLVITDEAGRERIVIGSPVPDPREGRRNSAATGIVINDPQGYERFGLGLGDDGRMGMGFDAPPGTGDSRNRERINIVADANGGAYIRFLNRKTFVPGRLVLDNNDEFYLEFLDFPPGKTVSRRIGFAGERTSESAR